MMIGYVVAQYQVNPRIYQSMVEFMNIFPCQLFKIQLDMLQIKEFLMQNWQRKIGSRMFSNFLLETSMILSLNSQQNTMQQHLSMVFAILLSDK